MARESSPENSFIIEFFRMIGWLFVSVIGLFAFIFDSLLSFFKQEKQLHVERKADHELKLQLEIRDDIESLQQSLKLKIAAANFQDWAALKTRFFDEAMDYEVDRNGMYPAKSIWAAHFNMTWKMFQDEKFGEIAPAKFSGEIEKARYIDYLIEQTERLKNPVNLMEVFIKQAVHSFLNIKNKLPTTAFTMTKEGGEKDSLATVPLLDVINDLPELIMQAIHPYFMPKPDALGLFKPLRRQIQANDERAGGELPPAEEFKGSRRQLLDAYLGGTPLRPFFDLQVPFDVPLSKQLEHSMIAAGSRYGKSQLIGSIISTHLKSDDPPGMIVIDSTGDFLKKITRLAVFEPDAGRLASRLLVVDPAQIPQLNMFDISNIRAKGYGESDIEQIEGDVVNLFEYVFRAIGSDLTPQQITATSFCIRLLLSMPGSSIETLVMLLELPATKFSAAPDDIQKAVLKLDITAQNYFKNQFFSDRMLATRTGVANRIYNVIKEPSFLRMFTGKNKIDFFEAMQQGKVIVVNTNKSLLQPKPSALFGRYIIARVMSAAFERSTINDMSKRRPCLLIIDEAQEYFDDSIETLLNQIGKFRLGICIAFQNFAQLNDKLRASVIGSTSVKYAGGLIGTEAHMIAREMRTTDEMILSQVKDAAEPPQWAKFAVRVSSLYEHAVSITVPFYTLENMPKMTEAKHAELMRNNKESVSPTKTAPPPVSEPAPKPTKPTQSPPDHDEGYDE